VAQPARVPLSLVPDIIGALVERALKPVRVWWRRSWIYRRFLRGPLPDRFVYYPYDALPRRLEDADALLRGRFRFAGATVEAGGASIFDTPPPSMAWNEALHAFQWLPPLAAAGGEASRTLASNLISEWLRRNGRYSEPAWSPETMARRLSHLFAHGRLVIANTDLMWRSRVFVALREQSRMLARIATEAPDGIARFEAAAIVAVSGACLDHSGSRLLTGIRQLENEIGRQILPDGGHVTRSPETLAHAYRCLTMVLDSQTATGQEIPQTLRNAHDKMAPMLRFFRHGDGALALFNGGRESDAKLVAGLLARDEVRGQPLAHARHSGYQRLAAARSLVILDCGTVPTGAFSLQSHAGCLAFEMSSGLQRIVVNCGSPGTDHSGWQSALRATAAHSTLVLADTSSAAILPTGLARQLLGPRLVEGSSEPETRRSEGPNGWRVDASHDGYARVFGLRHERQLELNPQGTVLTGADRLLPLPKARRLPRSVPFAVRFHIHPDVRMSQSQGGDILLKLPSGEGWRFRAGGGQITTEESVYLGGETVRRTEQIVISSAVKDEPAEVAWVFEQIGVAAD
jgi:uncharacterized heparinase superfamily protein